MTEIFTRRHEQELFRALKPAFDYSELARLVLKALDCALEDIRLPDRSDFPSVLYAVIRYAAKLEGGVLKLLAEAQEERPRDTQRLAILTAIEDIARRLQRSELLRTLATPDLLVLPVIPAPILAQIARDIVEICNHWEWC